MGFLKDFYDLPIWDFYEYRIFFPHGTVGYPVLVEFGFGLTSSMFVYIDSGGNQLIGREKNMPPSGTHGFPHSVP